MRSSNRWQLLPFLLSSFVSRRQYSNRYESCQLFCIEHNISWLTSLDLLGNVAVRASMYILFLSLFSSSILSFVIHLVSFQHSTEKHRSSHLMKRIETIDGTKHRRCFRLLSVVFNLLSFSSPIFYFAVLVFFR
jgi:hypothetical protein